MTAFPLSASPQRLAIIEKIVEICGAPEFNQRLDEILLEGLANGRYLAAEQGAEPYTGRVWYSTGDDARELLRDALEQVSHEEWESPRLFDLETGEELGYSCRRDAEGELRALRLDTEPPRPVIAGTPSSVRQAMNRR